MVTCQRLTAFLDKYLDANAVEDSSWNGLQIEGRREVRRVMCAVDAGKVTFEEAAARSADYLIVHHGLFWKPDNPSIRGWRRERIDLLRDPGISLYASHLPLDRHRVVGNNARLAALLNGTIREEFLSCGGKCIGWIARLDKARTVRSLAGKLEKELGGTCTVLACGPSRVRSFAVVSGGVGIRGVSEAIERGVQVFITGEPCDVYHLAKDAGINVIFAGHHASETLGVKALGGLVKKKFGVEADFVDIPTGL